MINEIWKPVPGFEDRYGVSNFGRVKSIKRVCKTEKGVRIVPEKILNGSLDTYGYLFVVLSKDGKHKNYLIHKLVMSAFTCNPENKPQINHLDGNKLNNNLTNLEWSTAKENINHKFKVLKYKQHNCKGVVCVETGEEYESIALAEKTKGKLGLRRHLKGFNKTYLGNHWKYRSL